jgi:GTPase involved in cell partitioning and DNA repair
MYWRKKKKPKGGDRGGGGGGGGRRLSTHYVTSHPLANEKKNQHQKSKYTNTLRACSIVPLMRMRE